jgi:hypothetical protein
MTPFLLYKKEEVLFSSSSFCQLYDARPKWQLSIGRFSQIWIQAIDMEIEQFKLPSIFLCYLNEPCTEI